MKVVTCKKTKEFVLLGDCMSCEHHSGMKCNVDGDDVVIKTLPYMSPSLINRNMTMNTSVSLHETILNYYVYTAICHPVNNIVDDEYRNFRSKFMRGEFALAQDKPTVEIPEALEPVAFLEEVDSDGMWRFNEKEYSITKPSSLEGKIKKVYWLYEVFENEGLADIQFANSFFALRTQPIKSYGEDMMIAVYDKGAVIGKRK